MSLFIFGISNYIKRGFKVHYNFSYINSSKFLLFRTFFSKFSRKMESFSLEKYDIIGFDLDNTLLRYKLDEMCQLEYNVIADYLVNVKKYSADFLIKSPKEDFDFIQKGLLLDFSKGNLLKIGNKGEVLRAAHGTKFLNQSEIDLLYNKNQEWKVLSQFVKDPLSTWNGPPTKELRALLDCFDMPAGLAFARLIDYLDATNKTQTKIYNVWSDILDAFNHIYNRENFRNGISPFFQALKTNPSQYIEKANQSLFNFLKELKKTKTTYLLTGSNIDFANLTASYALGENWQELFDIIVSFSRKPGFFTDNRPFYNIENLTEGKEIAKNIHLNGIYSQGNLKDLENCLKTKFNLDNVKHLYIGDNLIQDVYTPSVFCNIDTISIVEELENENSKYAKVLLSKCWGSYLRENTLWMDIIIKYSKICISCVDILAKNAINFEYLCFSKTNPKNGFYRV